LPFFKERLKEVSRELENTLNLTRVKNKRDGPVMAPTRNEFEQARRLGVNIRAVRQTIRDCFEHSDNGRSFEAALADHKLILTQGDRRDFVVIDHEGGVHALGKRILGVTVAQVRDRLADVNRDALPTVKQAREEVELTRSGERNEIAWEDQLDAAAIVKEKIEGRFVEPSPAPKPARPEKELAGTAADIPLAAALTDAGPSFAVALQERGLMLARVTAEDIALRDLNKPAKDRAEFAALDKANDWKVQRGGFDGLEGAQREKAQAAFDRWTERQPEDKHWDVSGYVGYVQRRFAKQRDRLNAMEPELQLTPKVAALARLSSRARTGDLVVVNTWGAVLNLTPESTGKSWDDMRRFMAGVPPGTLDSVATAQHLQKEARQARGPEAGLNATAADNRPARSFSKDTQGFVEARAKAQQERERREAEARERDEHRRQLSVSDKSREDREASRREPPKPTNHKHSFRQASRQTTRRAPIPQPSFSAKRRRTGSGGSAGGFRQTCNALTRAMRSLPAVIRLAERLSREPYTPPEDWNVVLWLDRWEQQREIHENALPTIGLPERPPTMGELYEFFKARGEIEYFFANICPDPAALIP
jgi:hypothetical protein